MRPTDDGQWESTPFDPPQPAPTTDRLNPSSDRRILNQYICGNRIGGGSNGEIFACFDNSDAASGLPLAVKAVKKVTKRDKYNLLRRGVAEDDNTLWSIQREIAIMKRCRHANVVRLVEVIDDPLADKIYIIMEYLGGGPIQWQTEWKEPLLALVQTRRIMRDTLLGLEYLHFEGIIHRDIKPANLLYTQDRCTVKIIDFGVAHYIPMKRILQREAEPHTLIDSELFPLRNLIRTQGTPFFQAPEIVNDKFKMSRQAQAEHMTNDSYDTISAGEDEDVACGSSSAVRKRRPPITSAIDIWSLGVTFYCFLFGHVPFVADPPGSGFALISEIINSDFNVDDYMGCERLPTQGRNPIDQSLESAAIVRLLERMLEKDPKRRIKLAELKGHPWLVHDLPDPKEWMKCTTSSYNSDNESSKSTWFKSGKKFLSKLLNSSKS